MLSEQAINSQRKRVLRVLSSKNPNGLTRMQVAVTLNIERSSVCARVGELAKDGRIFVVKRGICPITGFSATFITANKQIAMSLPTSARLINKAEQTGKLL